MAYDTLKAEIRQYIKTNGANEITGQILQNVLLDMVNAYPSLDEYATQQWVNTQLGDYLPLTGGTLTGVINFTNTYGSGSIFVDSTDYDLNITASNSIYLDAVRGVGVNGKITANTFEKSGGTSAQFLKADGSVDSNTYITESALSGYATQQWVNTQLGDYLPLTGGTLTGVVNFTNTYGSGSIFVDSTDYDLNITASNSIYLDAVRGVGVNGKITANTFEKSGGTSSQFLKADHEKVCCQAQSGLSASRKTLRWY